MTISSEPNYLNFMTILCMVIIFISFLDSVTKISYEDIENGNDTRNERSTPRTFVLPATPAVSFEQERVRDLASHKYEIQRCVLRLYDLGYTDIGNFDDYTSYKIISKIIEFQIESKIKVTGVLDYRTKSKLKCL